MDPQHIIARLHANTSIFKNQLILCEKEQYLFKTKPNAWCLLEIVCHLKDEEVEDFRTRVRHVLTTPDRQFPAFYPERLPEERQYLQQDFHKVLNQFLEERAASVFWLESLQNPNGEKAVQHPTAGPVSAKKLLVNWLAHDYHHIRQINAIQYDFLKSSSVEALNYAGKW